MHFFAWCRRAGVGLHVLSKPPVITASTPRDRMYTLCGYRVREVPGPIDLDGVLLPRVVPKSKWTVCDRCLAIGGEHDVMRSASDAREECQKRRLGMLGYGRDYREDAPVGWWLLWTRIAGTHL